MKNIFLDVIGFMIVVYASKYNNIVGTIFGLLLIFIDLTIKVNSLENKIEDLYIRLDNYKDIMDLNEEIKLIKNKLGIHK